MRNSYFVGSSTVLAAYEQDQLDWCIPDEFRAFHAQVVERPEQVRKDRIALLAVMQGTN